MITSVCFDVHGATADVIQVRALEVLAEFDPGFDALRWTISIEVSEEAVSPSGQTSLWRGEVTAKRHDQPR